MLLLRDSLHGDRAVPHSCRLMGSLRLPLQTSLGSLKSKLQRQLATAADGSIKFYLMKQLAPQSGGVQLGRFSPGCGFHANIDLANHLKVPVHRFKDHRQHRERFAGVHLQSARADVAAISICISQYTRCDAGPLLQSCSALCAASDQWFIARAMLLHLPASRYAHHVHASTHAFMNARG